jgi:hypothetical protein
LTVPGITWTYLMTPQPPRTSVVLGLLVLWQLFFLLSANLFGFLTTLQRQGGKKDVLVKEAVQMIEHLAPGWLREQGHLHEAQRLLTPLDKAWEQVTGQYQSWQLFAPTGRDIVFPAVEFLWHDDPQTSAVAQLAATTPWESITLAVADRLCGPSLPPPVLLLSENEPADITRYFRFGLFRIRRFESQLDLVLLPEQDKPPEVYRKEWAKSIRGHVMQEGSTMRNYLFWKWREYSRQHADLPEPTQLVFVARGYRIRAPEMAPPYWDGPFVTPLMRFRPRAGQAPADVATETYNPSTGRFEPLFPEGGP